MSGEDKTRGPDYIAALLGMSGGAKKADPPAATTPAAGSSRAAVPVESSPEAADRAEPTGPARAAVPAAPAPGTPPSAGPFASEHEDVYFQAIQERTTQQLGRFLRVLDALLQPGSGADSVPAPQVGRSPEWEQAIGTAREQVHAKLAAYHERMKKLVYVVSGETKTGKSWLISKLYNRHLAFSDQALSGLEVIFSNSQVATSRPSRYQFEEASDDWWGCDSRGSVGPDRRYSGVEGSSHKKGHYKPGDRNLDWDFRTDPRCLKVLGLRREVEIVDLPGYELKEAPNSAEEGRWELDGQPVPPGATLYNTYFIGRLFGRYLRESSVTSPEFGCAGDVVLWVGSSTRSNHLLEDNPTQAYKALGELRVFLNANEDDINLWHTLHLHTIPAFGIDKPPVNVYRLAVKHIEELGGAPLVLGCSNYTPNPERRDWTSDGYVHLPPNLCGYDHLRNVLNLYRDDKALSRLPTPEATAAVVKDVLSQYRQKDRDLGSIAEQLNEDAVRGDGFSAILTRDVFEQFANAIITIRLRRIRRAIQQLLDGLWGTADAFYLTSSLYEVVEKGLMWSEKTWGGTERMQDTSYVLFKQRVQSLLDQYFPSPVAAGRNG